MGRDLFGKRFGKVHVATRNNRPDPIHDDVVGNHMAHVLWIIRQPSHLGGHIEPHLLRPSPLETIGAYLDGKNELAHKDLVGAKPWIWPWREPTAKQSIVRLRRTIGRFFQRDQGADTLDGFLLDAAFASSRAAQR